MRLYLEQLVELRELVLEHAADDVEVDDLGTGIIAVDLYRCAPTRLIAYGRMGPLGHMYTFRTMDPS